MPLEIYKWGLWGRTFAFRRNPIPEKISFCRIEKISFLWKSPLHCLTLELKTKKVLSNCQNEILRLLFGVRDYIEENDLTIEDLKKIVVG